MNDYDYDKMEKFVYRIIKLVGIAIAVLFFSILALIVVATVALLFAVL